MARKAQRAEAPPTQVRLYSAAERREVPSEAGSLPKRRARVREFLRTGKVPAAWGRPTPAYEGRARLSEAEAARVVLPNFPKATLKLLPGDLGVERAVGRYRGLVGERETRPAREGTPGKWKPGGGWEDGTPAEPAEWSCGCKVWSDTRTEYTPAYAWRLPEFERYLPARVEACGRHKRALEGGDDE